MAKKDANVIARQIYEQIGGPQNVNGVVNCMTRVRLEILDDSKINEDALRRIDGVLGIVHQDGLQVVVGPGLSTKVAQAMGELANVQVTDEEPPSEDADYAETGREEAERKAAINKAAQKKKHDNAFNRALRSIANIFIPLIPAFVGAGIIGGIASIFKNMLTAGTIEGANWEYVVMIASIIQGSLFGYLNVYVGINAARVFGATEGLGGVVGGLVYLAAMNPEMPLPNIFTGQPLAGGQGGIIGVVFAVWILSIVEKNLRKVVPDALDIIITPTITLLVVSLLTIFLIMPLAGAISTGLVGFITTVLNLGGAVSGFVLGSLFLPMVMFGLHQILTPIHLEMLAQTGSTQLLPILAMAGAGQVGAAIALWVKARRNKQLSNMIKGALPVGILGIGEPLIYAVTLPLGRPFITACIGGGIGGAVIGAIGGIGATAIGPSGVALVPLIADGKWLGYVAGLLAAYAGGFIATYLFGVPKEAMEAVEEVTYDEKAQNPLSI